jgi:hypothetical protein
MIRMSHTHRIARRAVWIAAPTLVVGMSGAAFGVASASPRPTQPDGTRWAQQAVGVPTGLSSAIRRSLGAGVAPARPVGPQVNGAYKQSAELAPGDSQGGDFFGASVRLSSDGRTAIVGASQKNQFIGAAYVFVDKGGRWKQTAKLLASDGQIDDQFGSSVAIAGNGDTIVVGAPFHDTLVGAAYVFTNRGGSWTQTDEVTDKGGAPGDFFGSSIALSTDGSTLLGSAWGAGDSTGTVYLFDAKGGRWKQSAQLTAKGLDEGDQFGAGVALSGDGSTVVATSPYHGTGTAYVFSTKGSAWKQSAALTASDGAAGDNFGVGVATSADGSTIVVGSDLHNDETGAAYVYAKSGKTWRQSAELTASDGAPSDLLGRAVAVTADGGTAVIGADGVNGGVGAGYVFTAKKGGWKQSAELTASDGAASDDFGAAVAVSDTSRSILVGAFGHSASAGRAYVFAD